jgi:GT2 family glycosyltransferase
VPVYRDWEAVRLLLTGLLDQARPDCEIILVDNDPAAQNSPADLPELTMQCRIVHCAQIGSYAARNAGAGLARGEWFIFTDADCLPQPGWLDSLVNAAHGQSGMLAGPVILVPASSPNDCEIFDTVRGMRQEVFVRHGYAVTANLAVPRHVFERLAGFDATRLSGGDADFCRRAGREGFSLSMLPEAIVHHPARDSWQALVTKARRIKGGQVATGPRLHRIIWSLRSLVPPLREMLAYAQSPFPVGWRLIACCVRLSLWRVELREMVNLLILRSAPERR